METNELAHQSRIAIARSLKLEMATLTSEILERSGTSLAETHVAASAAMIMEAAQVAGSGQALILGCGKCGEIPVSELAASFAPIDLVDIDLGALESVATQYRDWQDAATDCRFHHADLTGLISRLHSQSESIVATSSDALLCLDQFGELLDSATPAFWRPFTDEQYQLVICSAVLTQLQASVRNKFENVFASRFPQDVNQLRSYQRWRNSIWNFARRLEAGFIDHLDSLCSRDGVIYLADTVQVCWLIQSGPQELATEGTWIATRTSRLKDYLHRENTVLGERQWQWLRREDEGPYWGRLYGVQAIAYRRRRAALPAEQNRTLGETRAADAAPVMG